MAFAKGNPDSSPGYAVTVTPNDSTAIPETKGLYIGSAGALKFRTVNGNDVTYANAIVGYHPLRVDLVYSTGTDATDIHAIY
jgi:hypothetical protein